MGKHAKFYKRATKLEKLGKEKKPVWLEWYCRAGGRAFPNGGALYRMPTRKPRTQRAS